MMTSTTIDVIGIGSPIIDLVAQIEEEWLTSVSGAKGGMELVAAHELEALLGRLTCACVKSPGGSAGNTTFALARMGLTCTFLGKVGNDDHGAFYREAFLTIGGDCSRFKTDDASGSACCVSLVTPDSERTMRTHLGAAMSFAPHDITPDDFAGCRHAHIEGYLLFNPNLLNAALTSARAAGCSISLDLGSFEVVKAAQDALPHILEEHVDIVFANEEEAAAFSGHDDPRAGLDVLGRHCDIAAVKIGRDGAWLKREDEIAHVPAMTVSTVRDTTGAGDYWASGFLYGHLKGYSLATCGRLGALMGGHVVQHVGAQLPDASWQTICEELNRIHETEGVMV